MRRSSWLGCALLAAVWTASADVASLSVTSDTFLVDGSPDANAGAHSHVAAGTAGALGGNSVRRGLFQFDLTTIPPAATVTSATLEISVLFEPGTAVDSTFEVYALTADWAEGVQSGNSGNSAVGGEVTWNSRFHGTTTWTVPGGDTGPGALDAVFIPGPGLASWSGTGLLAAVQTWVAGLEPHHGFLLRSDAEGTPYTAKQFGSREGGSPAQLIVGYDLPPPPPPLVPPGLIDHRVTATNAVLVWTNTPGQQYDVLYATSLDATSAWRVAEPNLPATPGGSNVWTDPPVPAGPLTRTSLFYAVSSRPASPTGLVLRLETVAAGLVAPVVATHAGDGSGRLFIAEQRGQILILDAATNLLSPPFLDISTLVTNLSAGYDERGLLGLAFHPGYATNRKFYVYYSAPKSGPGLNHESILAEYLASTTNVNAADPTSARVVLRFDQPEFNHNGGALAFGPDGYLYVATGDGGGGGDNHGPIGNAQNITNLLGKILRLDVDGALPYAVPPDNPFVGGPGADEIFAHGFRNPWKMSFEGTNLWVADVGQNLWEEINRVRRGGNYGWRIVESQHPFNFATAATAGVDPLALDYPIHEYRHGALGISIIGGAMAGGGGAYPALTNRYVFGDYSTGFGVPDGALYYLEETRTGIWERFSFYLWPTNGRLGRYVKGFGRGETGDLYLLSTTNGGPSGLSGDVRKLIPAP